MPRIPLPSAYNQSIDSSALPQGVGEQLIDGYVEVVSGEVSIRKRPGHELFVDLGVDFPVDGLFWWDAKSYVIAVCNGRVYKISSSDGNFNDITGDALTVKTHTIFANDDEYIFMASGGKIVFYTEGGTITPLFTGTGNNDATVSGTFTGSAPTNYYVEIDGTTAMTETFTGSGLDDLTVGGTYDGTTSKSFRVKIDATGTPDTFTWSNDGGSTWEAAGVAITGSQQTLEDGVSVTFGATTGHTLNDRWDWSAAPDTFKWSNDGGSTFEATTVSITGAAQSLEKGISITFDVTSGHVSGDTFAWWSGGTMFMADTDAPTEVSHVDYFDQYILANYDGTSKFGWSGVNAPQSWLSTSFASAESKPDELVALHVGWREITLFGKESIEVWQNDGVTPFSRLEGAYVERGCIAPYSVVNAGGIWIWLDHERRVSMLEGRNVKLVSGPYDDEIRNIAPARDAYANFITIGSHAFYIITFPSAEKTFVYDLANNSWYEWGTYDSSDGSYEQWRGKSYVYAARWQFHLIGDRSSTGKIYRLREDLFTDAGDEIRTKILTGEITHGTTERKTATELIMRCKRGVGNVTGNEPVFSVRWKNDNGEWSNYRQVSLGKIGDRQMIKRLFRLGQYRTRQYEIVHSDPSDFVLSNLEENVEADA